MTTTTPAPAMTSDGIPIYRQEMSDKAASILGAALKARAAR